MTDSIFLRPDVAARIEAFASLPPHSPPHLDDVIDDTGAVVWTALDALAAASPDLPPYLVLALAARPAADFLAHVGLPHAVAAHIDLLCPAMRPAAAAAADGSAPHIHLAAALVFPCLEATLAALATHRGVVSPPNMLKDLLLVPELADAEPARSRWLKSLLASNRGVNVRNLVWHGFCPEPELSLPLLALLLAALAEALAIASATPGVLDALRAAA
ncbi:uncharacterized protein AMSG_01076 [Thecamonas trahens ATCC 50062]|uniref:DUF4209 domain-containing protein n=1 Tax=Thecamonas trahens ATCC 50062 TaxID=461836 RepID=A0A0L0DIX1_THETB|nr:hypothetical protein AMSG_01076 [Thecamonas trahens ATCC 50062]KNC52247.1 hypothetical protein AMSG_01076 [Thecamonas trahens ATCC 50062]|eukprot:XP_013762249.1 hypothetical protein AMSG_01076 [Thecamonas trahens ATCC 50062]